MVPMVTEQQKLKRKKEKRKSTAKPSRPRKGNDGPYKEFKIVAFYDKDKTHQYVVGTSGNHKVAGRIMRQVGRKLDISHAQKKYSVSDGTPWILRQYNTQLPMLDENILDFYHFRDHVTGASHVLFGEGSKEASGWKEKMMEAAKNQGSLVMLDRLRECFVELKDDEKRGELENLREYVGKRIAMTDYPYFLNLGHDIGSGMRWDRDNAEAVMALASVYYSNQWDRYWKSRHKAA